MKENKYSIYFVAISLFFVTSLLTANIVSVKSVVFFKTILPAGILVFPITYILGDVLSEIYGYEITKKVIWLGFLANILFVFISYIVLLAPYPNFWGNQYAYEIIFGFTPRILIASLIAYLIGSSINAYSLVKIKDYTNSRCLWVRTIASTIIGEGLDSLIFITVAFFGVFPTTQIATIILNQWVIKVAYEVLATPITYKIINYIKKMEAK